MKRKSAADLFQGGYIIRVTYKSLEFRIIFESNIECSPWYVGRNRRSCYAYAFESLLWSLSAAINHISAYAIISRKILLRRRTCIHLQLLYLLTHYMTFTHSQINASYNCFTFVSLFAFLRLFKYFIAILSFSSKW